MGAARGRRRHAPRARFRVALAALLLAALGATAPVARAEVAGEDLEYLVRRLGYGAGIHEFKNYLLRGRPEYATQARVAFADALERLAAIERGGTADAGERASLAELRRMARAHDEALTQVVAQREKGWRIEDMDRGIELDAEAASAALQRLRAGRQWGELAEIEYQLGFGRGIHRFKDFVLRGGDEDREQALAALSAAEAAAESALERPGLPERDRHRFRIVARTAGAYRERLERVAAMHAEGRPVREVDLAVKVNDGPAVRALAGLRAGTGD